MHLQVYQVEDIDDHLLQIEKAGGKKLIGPVTLPDGKQFAWLNDPGGFGYQGVRSFLEFGGYFSEVRGLKTELAGYFSELLAPPRQFFGLPSLF